MVKVIVDVDCGNSPKKLFLKQFNTAFAEGDVDFLTASVRDDIVWRVVGANEISGKAEFASALGKIDFSTNDTMTIKRIITHGTEAAVNGDILLTNGDTYAFCDFYEFGSAKGTSIKVIESYNIAV